MCSTTVAPAANVNYIWDLISVEEYCEEIYKLNGIELYKIREIALKVLLDAKIQSTDDYSIAQSINNELIDASESRLRA